MKIAESVNDYGTPVSVHVCETCGNSFTLCPLVTDKESTKWPDCLAQECESYDEDRDVDKLFDDGEEWKIVREER